ncbi:MAG: SUMF1/EgtB/PvdO family nonheme iron enzyme [Planctomycetota bacterium]
MRNEVKSASGGKTRKWELAIELLCVFLAPLEAVASLLKRQPKLYKILLLALLTGWTVFVVSPRTALANAVSVNSASLNDTPGSGQATITFNVSQQNPFGNVAFDSIAFSDYIWVFIKFSTTSGSDGSWGHCILADGGTITPTADTLGVFIRSSTAGTGGNNFTVIWNYAANSVGAIDANTIVKVCAIEMVEIPTGSFYFNAGGIGITTGNFDGTLCYDGTGTNDGADQVLITAANQNVSLDASWPNGYTGFYLAKYEVSQQQFCDFLNTITATSAAGRYASTNYNQYGYLITNTGSSPITYTTTAPNRACNWLSWADTVAYLSWTALRPMTEMEFEKAARGTSGGTNTRTYPWGNTEPSVTTGTVDSGVHYIQYANHGATEGAKPILVGWYLSQGYAPANREWTGASPYGVADLAGNVWEHLINCDWTTVPANGNGTITPPASWPGTFSGKGIRGGGWNIAPSFLVQVRISDRNNAGWLYAVRVNYVGSRPARTK